MKYVKKDITTVDDGLVIHGVNCQGVMGSGVARAIRNKWPKVYDAYRQLGKGVHLLGCSHIVTISEDPILCVGNCYTQEYYGNDGKRYAELGSIESALDGVFSYASALGLTIHSPMIGCGLGGLKWEDVLEIYEGIINKYDCDNVFIYYL